MRYFEAMGFEAVDEALEERMNLDCGRLTAPEMRFSAFFSKAHLVFTFAETVAV